MATEYISRDDALDCFACDLGKKDRKISYKGFMVEAAFRINDIPAADVVTREAFNRILAENDDMREQLAAIGKKPGDDMTDIQMLTCCCCCGDSKVVEIDQVKEDEQ